MPCGVGVGVGRGETPVGDEVEDEVEGTVREDGVLASRRGGIAVGDGGEEEEEQCWLWFFMGETSNWVVQENQR